MNRLPLLLSVPHGGWLVPPEVSYVCTLSHRDILEDGDEGAFEIYIGMEDQVEALLATWVARAFVDLNRAEDDRSKDGVVKTHTCWDVPVYRVFPPEKVVEELLSKYHRPYHQRLSELSSSGVKLGIDCHTMAVKGPPVGPDPGKERPMVCLSNAGGTCPQEWMHVMESCFQDVFDEPIEVNHPFKGGHIIRYHASEMPWIQLDLSRTPRLSNDEKRSRVLSALESWCRQVLQI
jgi:N-formylglutamate deformylase